MNQNQQNQQTQNEFFYLSKSEKKYFLNRFNERCNERNEILYSDFKDIVFNYKRFEGETTKGSIDKIKRKNSISSISEAEMLITLDDYLNFIEIIGTEHEKSFNEKDPEISKIFNHSEGELFNLLSDGEPIMKIRTLTDIITTFELPIIIKDFFYPLGRKEINPNDDMNFSDFCSLFKSKSSNAEIFLRTFNGNINNNTNLNVLSETSTSSFSNFNKNLFPIEVKKHNKLYF